MRLHAFSFSEQKFIFFAHNLTIGVHGYSIGTLAFNGVLHVFPSGERVTKNKVGPQGSHLTDTTLLRSLFLAVQHGVGVGVVIHLHLLVDLHILASGSDIVKQLIDGRREVALLLQ